MELTPREAKMLANMRKQQEQWPKVRWLQLLIGLGIVIAFSYLFSRLSDFLKDDLMLGVAAFALIAPLILLWMLIGGYKLGHALVEWHGNPERTLLLKLIDEVEGKKQ